MGCKVRFCVLSALFASIASFAASSPIPQTSSSSTPSISLVQSANTEGSGVSSLSQSFSAPNAPGNLIVAFVRMSTVSQTVEVTDSLGNVYKEAVSQVQADDGHQIHIFYAANVLPGANKVTSTFSNVNNHPWLAIFEYSGLARNNPLDVTSSAQGSSALPSSGNTPQSQAANELIFTGMGLPSSSSAVMSTGAGFLLESQDRNTPGSRGGVEDQISTSTASFAGAFSLSDVSNWTTAVATFISAQLSITTTSLPDVVQGIPYNAALHAIGGAPPYTWSINGSLPPGLSVNSAGGISGTPNSAGSYSFVAQVADADGTTATQSLAIQVNAADTTAISLVQSSSIAGTAVSSLSQAFPTPNTAGNLIVAFVRMSTTSQTVQVADSVGNVYSDAVSQAQSADGHQTHIFYAANIAGGANTITASFSGANNHPWLAIYEYRGLDSKAPLDRTAHAEGSGATASTGPAQTTTSARELVFGGVGLPASSTQTAAADTGFTLLQQDAPPDTSRAANVQVVVNTPAQYAASFSLSGVTNWTAVLATFQAPPPAQGELAASPANIDFGSVTAGSSSTQSLSITNTGAANAVISEVTESGEGFSVDGLSVPYSLAPNASLTIRVTFAPGSPAVYSGTLKLTSDAQNSTLNIGLSGTGTQAPKAQIAASPSTIGFGSVNTGASSTQTITLTNSGNASATITQVSSTGLVFSVNGLTTPYTLASGAAVTLSVTFAPTAVTSYSGTITIVSDAINSQLTIPLSGTGSQPPQPQISASPNTLNFATISACDSTIQSLALTNTGTATANITQVSTSGMSFSATGIVLPYSLAPGATVSLQITFSPALAGGYIGTATITSDTANSPLSIPLSGTATHCVSLSWTDSDPEIAGYNVYRSTQSGGPYDKLNGSLVSLTTWNDSAVQPGRSYYYVLTAVASSGAESAYSVEASAAIPNP